MSTDGFIAAGRWLPRRVLPCHQAVVLTAPCSCIAQESKKKWLGGQFQATFGKRTAAAVPRVPLITAQTDYYPPLLHKFRDEDKRKFVSSRDFIVA